MNIMPILKKRDLFVRSRFQYFVLTALVCLDACSPVKIIRTQSAEGFTLSSYKTFDFYKLDVSGEPTPVFSQRVKWIKEELARRLVQRGLVQATSAPDLLVNIGLVVKEKTQTRETTIQEAPVYVGQRNYHWESEEVVVDRYKQGTVTIDLVERINDQMVWEAVASSIIVKNDAESGKNITHGAKKLFEKMNP